MTASIAVLTALALAGCGSLLKTPYSAPQTTVPAQWQHADGPGLPDGKDKWWENFEDPVLNQLVDTALRRNNGLADAAIAVRRAQLQAGLAADKQVPVLGANSGTSYNRALNGLETVSRVYSLTGTVSYEADLWGKLARQSDVAQWEALATAEDRDSAALSVTGTTMTLYWQIAYFNQRIALTEQNIASSRRTLELAQVRRAAGAVSSLDVLQAEQALFSLQAGLTQLLRQRVESRNALAILFDGPPEAAYPELRRLPVNPLPSIGLHLPAHLVGRRPDLRAAELRLRKTLTAVDVTRTSYYPVLTLTGSLGSSSTELLKLLRNPVAILGAGLTLPFLQWNEMRLNTRVSEADHERAVVNFRDSLYKAFGEVENALSARTQYDAESGLLVKSLDAASAAERISEVQYRAGAVPLKSWLDAQQLRRDAEATLSANRLNQLTNLVTLYKALGGNARIPPQDF